MTKKYLVSLTDEELATVFALTHKGRIAARRLTRAHILRLAHEQQTDETIAQTLHTSVATIERVRDVSFWAASITRSVKSSARVRPANSMVNRKPFWLP